MSSRTTSSTTVHRRDLVFDQHNLISDGAVPADHVDPLLVNPWGVSFGPTGPFWLSDNGTGVTTIYNGAGVAVPAAGQLVVTIPAPPGEIGSSTPTGQVFAGGNGFAITENGKTGNSIFLFATEDGTISGWTPAVDASNAVIAVDHSADGAVYKGLAIAPVGDHTLLFAANFAADRVEAYDQSFNLVNSFTDPFLPKGYAPFNVQALDGHLFVTYALRDANGADDVRGHHHGFVDEFNFDGTLVQRIASGGPLDSPWGLAIAPASFGAIAGDLLVGNFGSGTIDVFDLPTGAFEGKLRDADHKAIHIDGLWALTPGNGGLAGRTDTIYFTAGPDDETHGLFGSLTPHADAPLI